MFVRPKIKEIKRRRENMGWSQHRLSMQAGLSGCAVSRIESGKTVHIHILRAREIAKALHCEVEDTLMLLRLHRRKRPIPWKRF